MRLPSPATLVGALVALVICAGALANHQRTTSLLVAQRQSDFETRSKGNHQRVLRILEARRQALSTLSGFFAASTEVSPEEFRVMTAHLRGDLFDAACFVPDRGPTLVDLPEHAPLCEQFDLLEPSRVIGRGEDTRIILARPAQNANQSGTVAILFPMGELLPEAHDDLREFLLVSNSSQHTVDTYTSSEGALTRLSAEQVQEALVDRRVFDLDSLGSVQFLYATSLATQLDLGQERLLTALWMSLGLMSGLYLRNLLMTREHVRAEVEARTAELSQFAYRTSHDLRGPLVTVAGLCRILREDVDDGEYDEVPETTRRIEGEVDRLSTLVLDILDLARADVGTVPTELFDVREVVRDTIDDVARAHPDHAVAVTADVAELPPVLLPRARVASILENLVSNGVKYADPDRESKVTIEARKVSADLQIRVIDNGLGISAEHQETLFDVFTRFHPDVGAAGSGLGMSIVGRHVEAMGGTCTVESDRRGTMVTFRVPLPRSPT